MAQLEGMSLSRENSRTMQQLLHSDSPTAWDLPSSSSSSPRRLHDQEEVPFPHGKKLSIIARVKEKARKWRQSFSRKRHGHDRHNSTPSWGVSLEDYEVEEDAEHLKTPIYESEQAPENSKQKPRQQTRNDLVMSEKNRGSNSQSERVALTMKKTKGEPALTRSQSDQQRGRPTEPKMKLKDTLTSRSIGNHQSERVSSSINAGKEKDETTKTVEDIMNKQTSHVDKGKAPMASEADEDQERPISLQMMIENEAIKSNNTEEKQQKAPTTKKVTVCEANHVGTSKIQDLSQAARGYCSSLSSQNPAASIDATEVEDLKHSKTQQTS